MSNKNAFESWLKHIELNEPCLLATVIHENMDKDYYQSKQLFVSQKMKTIGSLGNAHVDGEVKKVSKQKFNENQPMSETREFYSEKEGTFDVFLDVYTPPINLMIFGAGHDAIPVAALGNRLGLKVTIVDGRTTFNNEKNFPNTTRTICRETELEEHVFIDSKTYIVVMNHHIEKDRKTLQYVLKSPASYVGVLGPLSRRKRMLENLIDQGISFSNEELKKMYSPVGLDIGARSSEEIAVSILAEIISVRNGMTGGFLRGMDIIHRPTGSCADNE